MSIGRSVDVAIHLTVGELADQFCSLDADKQALFFNEVGRLSKQWSSGGFAMQARYIVDSKNLDADGRSVMSNLSDHAEDA